MSACREERLLLDVINGWTWWSGRRRKWRLDNWRPRGNACRDDALSTVLTSSVAHPRAATRRSSCPDLEDRHLRLRCPLSAARRHWQFHPTRPHDPRTREQRCRRQARSGRQPQAQARHGHPRGSRARDRLSHLRRMQVGQVQLVPRHELCGDPAQRLWHPCAVLQVAGGHAAHSAGQRVDGRRRDDGAPRRGCACGAHAGPAQVRPVGHHLRRGAGRSAVHGRRQRSRGEEGDRGGH